MIVALLAIFDVILSGGRVVDGTGAPWFRADVGIRGDSIAAVGDLAQEKARRRVNVNDAMISPGFIDMLGQSELQALVDPREESKVRQGITTELSGEGISPAPMNAVWIHEQEPWLAKYKLKIDWKDLNGYWKRLRKARPSINEAILVGAAQVRGIVLGMGDVQPAPEQLKAMQKLVEQAMRQGAFGVSTGLIYQPGSYAKTPELIALAQAAAKHHGIYATHMRSEAKKIGEALDETFAIAREAHIPVEIWHLKVAGRGNWGRMREVIDRIQRARAEGLDVSADMYPYIASANGLDASIPDWAHADGVDAMVKRIHDPQERAKMIAEMEADGLHPEDILILAAVNPEVKKFAGMRLDKVSAAMNEKPVEALVDLVALDRASTGVARFGMSEEDVKLGLSQPFVSMCTDYGAMAPDGPFAAEGSAHPRAFASTARILGHYVRDEKLFSVEEAVRKMTSLPARRLGLEDRGVIRPGMKADLVVFEPEKIEDTATFEKPLEYPAGIRDVLVNGKLVLAEGKRTSARPGRALLHCSAPSRSARRGHSPLLPHAP
jgi:N-acyl-D-amino-acid deacylase